MVDKDEEIKNGKEMKGERKNGRNIGKKICKMAGNKEGIKVKEKKTNRK